MKTLNLIAIVLLFVFSSCKTQVKTDVEKVDFGVYEMVTTDNLPSHIIDSLQAFSVQLQNNPELSIIGYISDADLSVLELNFSKDNIKFLKTYNKVDTSKFNYAFDSDKEYYIIAALKLNPVMVNADIRTTKPNGNHVDIEFNFKGAKKWAEMTRTNTGRTVAFVIDNQIYSMPLVNYEINRGIAMIYGLESEMMAEKVSESLNASRE
jgi:preprotein translocase subunit SecD